MSRESAAAKGHRDLLEGRLVVEQVDRSTVSDQPQSVTLVRPLAGDRHRHDRVTGDKHVIVDRDPGLLVVADAVLEVGQLITHTSVLGEGLGEVLARREREAEACHYRGQHKGEGATT
jgi:hypothetical protein